MAECVLVIHCARVDAALLVDAVQAVTSAPVHVREESVFGRDYADASTAECVTGALERAAIELCLDDADVDAVSDAVRLARRQRPVRWRVLPLLAQGRFE